MPAQQPNANIPLPVHEAKQKVLLPAQEKNKKTLRTMRSNFLQSTDPSTGNVTFSGLEPWVSSFGNPQFLTMKAA